MTRRPTAAPHDVPNIDRLATVVEALTRQVRQLALILDEIREDLVWAVRNDRLTGPGASLATVADLLEEAVTDESPVPLPVRPTTPQPKRTQPTLFR